MSFCLLAIPAAALPHPAFADNTCPIIFVHGFAGWGPQEFGDTYYWGGDWSVQQLLEEEGFTVFVADVGPFSSNWDRAVELFYQIRGGQVDYGAEHSSRYGHEQRPEGKCYANALYPQWDADHPVHFVGHSMGGQTIRILAALLHGSCPQCRNVLRDRGGTVFTPGTGWIKSITTISTPHNGSSLFSIADNPMLIAGIILGAAGLRLNEPFSPEMFDFDLEHWNFSIEDNETLKQYLLKVGELFESTEDFSIHELTPEGATKLNAWANLSTMDNSTYFFSYSNEQSHPGPLDLFYMPDIGIKTSLRATSSVIGLTPEAYDLLGAGPMWRENDGLVNTYSMSAPLSGCGDGFVMYDGVPRRGSWNFMGKLPSDHFDIIGHSIELSEPSIQLFYRDLASFLWSLE